MELAVSPITSLDASVVELIVLGVAAFLLGILAGMVGVALGIIRLPVMLAMGFNPVVSAGTNLGVSILGGATAAWPHYQGHRVVARVLLVIGFPAVAGSFVGGLYAEAVPAWTLLVAIATILGISSLQTLRQVWEATHPPLRPVRHRPPSGPDDPTGISRLKAAHLAFDSSLGLVIGLIGGAVGMVLGSLRLPVLVNVLRMSPGYAAGTNNAIGVLAGVFGFVGHAVNGNIDLLVLAVMGVSGMAGSYIGALQTGRVNPILLRTIIGLTLVGVTPLVILRAVSTFPD